MNVSFVSLPLLSFMRWVAPNKLAAFPSEQPFFCAHISIFPSAAPGVRKVASGCWGKLVLDPIRLKSESWIAGVRLCKASSRVAPFSTAHILLPCVIVPLRCFRCMKSQRHLIAVEEFSRAMTLIMQTCSNCNVSNMPFDSWKHSVLNQWNLLWEWEVRMMFLRNTRVSWNCKHDRLARRSRGVHTY